MRIHFTWLLLLATCFAAPIAAEETFRTDASEDEKLPWYQTVPGQFPPEGSAHYYTGELVSKDHIHRKGMIRVSRTDKQRRSHWDLPVDFRLLPYGSLAYHGAPAALKDIPIGTHLHGLWYIKDEGEETKSLFYNRKSIESDFTKAFRLVDDFTYYQQKNQLWQVDRVDLKEMKLYLVSQAEGEEKPTAIEVDLTPATRVYLGKQFATLEDIQPGQNVLFNLTWATLYGVGRCTELWLDEESRQIATAQQRAQHLLHQKDRGIAGIIDAVDNQNRILTVTFFGGIDPTLLEDFKPNTTAQVCVSEPTLQIYDQVNDKKGGPILSVEQVEKRPGSSGIQVRVQPSLLLEGYRPGRIVRIFPSGWPIVTLPEEETLWPERD
ncbi:hypothetical protein C5Y96_25505 [Blastopirellula marina]|uniref:Uncharacterized protein n=1 Tax=Blastopirellula marina TaxID=124 RepID=A0A2S8EZD1_9BACT|nr:MULTISPECIES: hypothetical protein [Pirellulaceae]PQO25263.1 hypothetical protein C5Y96_25505 [Blastopirellula marina]RCS41696.1 hypothetical protein DTL36_25555 [Bremerella cremea]